MKPLSAPVRAPGLLSLSPREIAFLRLACSELTYHEIAATLHVSPRTVDGYREDLFEKVGVKSRVGLALWAVKTGVVVL